MPIWQTVAELQQLNQALAAGHVAAARRIVRKALAAAKAQEAAYETYVEEQEELAARERACMLTSTSESCPW